MFFYQLLKKCITFTKTTERREKKPSMFGETLKVIATGTSIIVFKRKALEDDLKHSIVFTHLKKKKRKKKKK